MHTDLLGYTVYIKLFMVQMYILVSFDMGISEAFTIKAIMTSCEHSKLFVSLCNTFFPFPSPHPTHLLICVL